VRDYGPLDHELPMRARLKPLFAKLARSNRSFVNVYRRMFNPDGTEWAELLRHHNMLHAMGSEVSINPGTYFADPKFTRLGNNVRLSTCTLIGHDGSVNMINRAYDTSLDSVGKIDIRDNVFVGHGAIILPGVTIGPNAIVSAGSVVNRNVNEGEIVSGVPAKVVGQLDMHVAILTAKNNSFPWKHLIDEREGDFDPEVEEKLNEIRIKHFFDEG